MKEKEVSHSICKRALPLTAMGKKQVFFEDSEQMCLEMCPVAGTREGLQVELSAGIIVVKLDLGRRDKVWRYRLAGAPIRMKIGNG